MTHLPSSLEPRADLQWSSGLPNLLCVPASAASPTSRKPDRDCPIWRWCRFGISDFTSTLLSPSPAPHTHRLSIVSPLTLSFSRHTIFAGPYFCLPRALFSFLCHYVFLLPPDTDFLPPFRAQSTLPPCPIWRTPARSSSTNARMRTAVLPSARLKR